MSVLNTKSLKVTLPFFRSAGMFFAYIISPKESMDRTTQTMSIQENYIIRREP
ncbi:hypothetical protein X762_30260 [Mesorhizobium sp. LSHC426A00]|nr:hypothetical protein X762_30260 [Mesorhizobium sp. LSHC426A00]